MLAETKLGYSRGQSITNLERPIIKLRLKALEKQIKPKYAQKGGNLRELISNWPLDVADLGSGRTRVLEVAQPAELVSCVGSVGLP